MQNARVGISSPTRASTVPTCSYRCTLPSKRYRSHEPRRRGFRCHRFPFALPCWKAKDRDPYHRGRHRPSKEVRRSQRDRSVCHVGPRTRNEETKIQLKRDEVSVCSFFFPVGLVRHQTRFIGQGNVRANLFPCLLNNLLYSFFYPTGHIFIYLIFRLTVPPQKKHKHYSLR